MTLIPTDSEWKNILIDLCRNCKHVIVFESKKVNRQNLSDGIRQHIPDGSKTLSANPTECKSCGYKQTNSIRSALAYRFVCPCCQRLVVVPREPLEIVKTPEGIVHRYQHDDVCCECGETLRATIIKGDQVVMIVVPDPENKRKISTIFLTALLSYVVVSAVIALYWYFM